MIQIYIKLIYKDYYCDDDEELKKNKTNQRNK